MTTGHHVIDIPDEVTVKLKFSKSVYDLEKTKYVYRSFHISAIDFTHFYVGEHKGINVMHTSELASLLESALSFKILD
jgi:hypothetical protein